MFLEKLEDYYYFFSQRKAGWFVLLCVAMLMGIGLVALSSASLSFIKPEGYFIKQVLWILMGVPFFLLGCLVDLNFLRKYAVTFLVVFMGALVLVLIPGIGRLVNGSRRWIAIGGINIQISEFAKIMLIIWLARYIENNKDRMQSFWRGFIIPLGIAGAVCLLVLAEPDYGTAMLMGVVAFTLLYLAGSRLPYMAMAMATGLAGISMLIVLNPTRMRRIVAFLDIENNKLGGAYQLWQGILGFVSGGLSGRGIGQGRQQLIFLPEAHTDFIFSILSEELGSIIAIVTLFIYFLLFVVAVFSTKKMRNDFTKFLSYGIGCMVIYQVAINVGVVTGLLPTKGIVLPFISYGGSSLIGLLFMVGLLLNCMSSEETKDFELVQTSSKDGFFV